MSQPSRIPSFAVSLYIATFFFLAPAVVFASVRITEVMYDAPGSDTGREWIEVQNTGPSTVDLRTYRFVESGKNHTIVSSSGSSTLSPGSVAVIVKDPQTFAASWPKYAGLVFKSSFSLSNTGESLNLRVGTSTTLDDSVVFSSAMGASGNGLSLHRVGDTFVATDPDPGIVAASYSIKNSIKTAPTATGVSKTLKKASESHTVARVMENAAPPNAVDEVGVAPGSVASGGNREFPWWTIGVALSGLIILGGAGVVYAQRLGTDVSKSDTEQVETFPSVDEFDIQ